MIFRNKKIVKRRFKFFTFEKEYAIIKPSLRAVP